MSFETRSTINYNILPEHDRDAMRLYIEHGIDPGGFLRSALENNLVEAFKRANPINIAYMHNVADFLYNEAPMECWGSPDRVNYWLRKK